MYVVTEKIPIMKKNRYFGPAMVLDINENEGLVLLSIENEEGNIIWGKSAIPCHHKFIYGETVLVVSEDNNAFYIIGLLNNESFEKNKEERLFLKNGAYASVTFTDESEKFQLCSGAGELIFEYDPETGKSLVNIQSGDLEFVTKNGNINFISEQGIHFTSKQSIEMESRYGICMAVTNVIRQVISSMSIKPVRIKLNSPELGIAAQRGEVLIEESMFIGNKFSATFKQGKFIFGKLESIANDIITKARNIYSTIDELIQLKTGRMRTLIKSTLHMKANKTYLKSKEDFKINADKIHLG